MTGQETTKAAAPVTKREESRKITEVVRVYENLPELEREKVIAWLQGVEFAAATTQRSVGSML
jgi:hypothetical protein